MDSPLACLERAARGLLAGTEPVLVAVSGGSDSVALLLAAREVLSPRVRIAHVDHGLRAESEADAGWVAGLGQQLGIPVRIVSAPPTPADDGTTETAARRRRLEALGRVAREERAPWVLLGQHADDDLETLLLHLRRGHRGDRIVAGIPPVRALAEHASLVRPFLLGDAPPDREALTRLRSDAGLECRDDPSNRDETIPRSALRARLAGGDLADLAAPGFRTTWLGLRRRARARLQARLLSAVLDLRAGLAPMGLGCRIAREAIPPLSSPGASDPSAPPDEGLAERLRLVGACLAEARRVDPRGAVLRRVRKALESGHGTVELPAAPRGLRLQARPDGLHLPREALASPDPVASLLAAVAAGSLYP